MTGIGRILRAEGKNFIKAYLGALFGGTLVWVIARLFLDDYFVTDMGNTQLALKVSIATGFALISLFMILIYQPLSAGVTNSMALKLGYTRKDFTIASFIKDVVVILILSIVTSLSLSYVGNNLVGLTEYSASFTNRIIYLSQFGNALKIVVFFSSLITIAGMISALLGFDPMTGSLIFIPIIGAFMYGSAYLRTAPFNPIIVLIVFIIAQGLRYIVINKIDTKY